MLSSLCKHAGAVGPALAFCFIVTHATSLSAATVSPIRGDVRISTEQGFRKIDGPTEASASTRVMVSPGGMATIAYDATCSIQLQGMATIQERPPCGKFPRPSYLGVEESSTSYDDIGYGFTPKVGGQRSRKTADDNCTFDAHTLLIIGGVLVAAGVTAAVLANQGSDASASP